MPLTTEQKKTIKNHIPTVKRLTDVFLTVFDVEKTGEEEKMVFLKNLIDVMETNLKDVKDILDEVYP